MSITITMDSPKFNYKHIRIDEVRTEDAVNGLKQLIQEGIVYPNKAYLAKVMYDCLVGISADKDSEAHYPLRVFTTDSEVLISGVTAGYSGEGPNGTLECLKLLGFRLAAEEKDKILNKPLDRDGYEKTYIHREFIKNH